MTAHEVVLRIPEKRRVFALPLATGVTDVTVRLAEPRDLSAFFCYMDEHLRENGSAGSPLFQPISRSRSRLDDELRSAFRVGLSAKVGQNGWRRLMLAERGSVIAGHADLRGYRQATARHRALVGMGVAAGFRRAGVGTALLEELLVWARRQRHLEYVDLWVLSDNHPARKLYDRLGFRVCGEVEDMFRVDGKAHDYTMMSKRLAR